MNEDEHHLVMSREEVLASKALELDLHVCTFWYQQNFTPASPYTLLPENIDPLAKAGQTLGGMYATCR